MPDGLRDIECHWSLDDVLLAHDWLDAYDDAEAKAVQKMRRKTKKGGR